MHFTTVLFHSRLRRILLLTLGCLLAGSSFTSAAEKSWWNHEWTIRKKIVVDMSAAGANLTEPIGSATAVLVRLHDGNFQFAAAREDGSDLRFVSDDDKTLLAYHIERIDPLLNEAFVWVKLPEIKSGATTAFWLYYGNAGPQVTAVADSKATYDAETVLVYHFGANVQADATGSANNADNAATKIEAALIAGGVRLPGAAPISVPASPSLLWNESGTLTWSAWIKPASLQPRAIIFSRREEGRSLVIGLDNGVPFVEIGGQRSSGGEALAPGAWRHLAIVAAGGTTTVYLDGVSSGTLAAGLPALNSASLIGGDTEDGAVAFSGEMDELQIAKAARTPGFLKFAALSQAGEKAAKLIVVGNDEQNEHAGGGEMAKQLSLITDISKSLTFDGWVVIVLCALLAVVGWIISIGKFLYLNKVSKSTRLFLEKWKQMARDLHVLDHGNAESIRSMGGKATLTAQKTLRHSPLYQIYQLGSEEIQHRLASSGEEEPALSGRTMQAIRAVLHGGLVREVQKLNSKLVFLTIGIAGGPYLGLLGTVIGVMITFAVIAKSGQVEVNSIAPGIAGALLATVAGLAVAIPALFAYSYISSRIKDAISDMEIFIDEFVARIAEAYPETQGVEHAEAGLEH
jgi:biopolymer transport protein ExbB